MRNFLRRKRFGQHFLNNKRLAKRIVDFAQIEDTVVVEIGSGKGILTKQIAERAKKVFAVEIDRNLAEKLENFALPNVVVVNEDFLKLRLKDFSQPVIVGNIPYSITTSIFQTLIKQKKYLKRAVLTIQKEYGERICAQAGCRQYGAITLFLNYHFTIKKCFIIPAKYFSPQPKVNSIVISFTKKQPPFELKDEEKFFQFTRGIFQYRRKLLKNAIVHSLHKIPKDIEHELLQKRPEKLSLDEFNYIFNLLEL